VVRAAAPRPVNLLVPRPIGLTMADIAALGVRRVSLGGALAGLAWGALSRAMDRVQQGDLAALGDRLPGAAVDDLFVPPRI